MVKNSTRNYYGKSHTDTPRLVGVRKHAFWGASKSQAMCDTSSQARCLREHVLRSLQGFEGRGFFKTQKDINDAVKAIRQHPLNSLEALSNFTAMLQPLLSIATDTGLERKIASLREYLQKQSELQRIKDVMLQEVDMVLKVNACHADDAKQLRAVLEQLDPTGFSEEEVKYTQGMLKHLNNPRLLPQTHENIAAANALLEDGELSLESLRI